MKDLSVQIVQCREQGQRAMAGVVVRFGSDMTKPQRESRLRSLQCLALALFVAAQNQGAVGRL